MKKIPVVSILLTLAVLTSIGLSYLLLFNPMSLYETINRTGKVETETIKPTTNQPLEELLLPISFVKYDGTHYTQFHEVNKINDIFHLLALTPSEIQDITVEKQASSWVNLMSKNRLEFELLGDVPVNVLKRYFSLREGRDLAYEIDRIIWTESEPNHLYLANSTEQSYLLVETQQQEQLQSLYQENGQGISVQPIQLQHHLSYLPTEKMELMTEWYTMKKRSEAQFLNTFFGSSNYSITDTTNANERKYKTYNLELDLFTDSQTYIAKSETYQSRATNTLSQLLVDSFSELIKYDYWNLGLRYMPTANDKIIYRRLMNGYPIISQIGFNYGGTQFEMTPKVTRFSGSLIDLRSHISDKSQKMTLADLKEIEKVLTEQGLTWKEMDRVFVGYEWQKETENLQLAQFIPKWYVEYKGRYFTLAEIQDGTIKKWSQTQQSKEKTLDSANELGGDE